jgi:hypothetical protein
VKIVDVISFLLRGGVNGMRNAWKDFQRLLFRGRVSFGSQPATGVWLTTALLAVLSLVVANFIVTVMFADRLAGRIARPRAAAPRSRRDLHRAHHAHRRLGGLQRRDGALLVLRTRRACGRGSSRGC